jgi:hypothetical protein
MFTKVKETNELFVVALMADPDRTRLVSATNPLRPEKEYLRHYSPGSHVGENSQWIDAPELNRIEWFRGEEFEGVQIGGIRVVYTGPSVAEESAEDD